MVKIKETSLASPIIEFMQQQEFEMYKEVRLGGMGKPIVDLVGMKTTNDRPVFSAIELKTTLGLRVIEQAHGHLKWAHYSSVVVPAPIRESSRSRVFAEKICRDYGIGLITINTQFLMPSEPSIAGLKSIEIIGEDNIARARRMATHGLREVVPAQMQKGPGDREEFILGLITDDHRVNSEEFPKAGSKGGGYVTPYKTMIKVVKAFITDHPGCSIEEIESYLTEEFRLGNISYVPRRYTLMTNLREVEKSWCLVRKRKKFNSYYVM